MQKYRALPAAGRAEGHARQILAGAPHHVLHELDAVAGPVVGAAVGDGLDHRDGGGEGGAGAVSEEVVHLEHVKGFNLVHVSPFLLLL